jgi:hypothetical protein
MNDIAKIANNFSYITVDYRTGHILQDCLSLLHLSIFLNVSSFSLRVMSGEIFSRALCRLSFGGLHLL